MPLYNCERYFEAAAASVSTQTHTDLEVIAVDDGSTDATATLAERWSVRDPRVRLFRIPHGGLVGALNFGLSRCTAPLVARMDGDDIALPRRLERQLAILRERPDIGVIGCAFDELHGEERRPGPRLRVEPSLLAWRAHFFVVLAHPTAVFRRSLLEQVGGYSPDVQNVAEDFNLVRRLSRITLITNVPEVLFLYRRHSEASTGVYSDSIEANSTRVCQLALTDLLEEPVAFEVAAQLWRGSFTPGDTRAAPTLVRAFRKFVQQRRLSGPDRRLVARDVLWLLYRGGGLRGHPTLSFCVRHPLMAARVVAAGLMRGQLRRTREHA
jgi:glycosyltransferase involved in cell wall biosynthesis